MPSVGTGRYRLSCAQSRRARAGGGAARSAPGGRGRSRSEGRACPGLGPAPRRPMRVHGQRGCPHSRPRGPTPRLGAPDTAPRAGPRAPDPQLGAPSSVSGRLDLRPLQEPVPRSWTPRDPKPPATGEPHGHPKGEVGTACETLDGTPSTPLRAALQASSGSYAEAGRC